MTLLDWGYLDKANDTVIDSALQMCPACWRHLRRKCSASRGANRTFQIQDAVQPSPKFRYQP